jgi:hypothetical protein
MTDSQEYTPLSERIQLDVWHDNFVPRYSAIATAEPNKLFLIGIWLLFLPMAFPGILTAIAFADSRDLTTATIVAIVPTLFSVLAVTILYIQTRRYLVAASKRHRESEQDEDTTGETRTDATNPCT